MTQTIIIDPHIVKPYAVLVMDNSNKVLYKSDKVTIPGLFRIALGFKDLELCIIEGQYSKYNIDIALRLAASRGRAEGILEILSIPIKVLLPMVWKKHYKFAENEKKYTTSLYKQASKFLNSKSKDLADCLFMYLYNKKLSLEILK